jgi:hypothetical protein
MIFFDVTNVCNLDCPFCSTDWDRIRKGVLVKDDVLKKVFQLAPYVHESSLSLSCAHEATMHPHLPDILDSLPKRFRRKFFMTSNMTTKMSDKLIAAIARSGMGHLAISCDTLEAEKFKYLRRRGDLSVFLHNVNRLREALRDADPATTPKLRLISMAFKSNFAELPKLVEFGKSLGAVLHELRFLFDVPHMSPGFAEREILDDAEWDRLVLLEKTEPTVRAYPPPPGYRYSFQRTEGEGVQRAIGLASRKVDFAALEKALASGSQSVATNGQSTSPADGTAPRNSSAQEAASYDEVTSELLGAGQKVEARARKVRRPAVETAAPVKTVNGTVLPRPTLAEPITLHVAPDGSAIVGDWGQEPFEINLLSIPDPGLFFSSLVPGCTKPLDTDVFARQSPSTALQLSPGVHGDLICVVDDQTRAAVWGGELRLELYVAGDVSAMRVAYCNVEPAGNVAAVAEKYFDLRPGFQIVSLRLSDCVPTVGTITADNLTRIHVGGSTSEKAANVFGSLFVENDGELMQLSLTSTSSEALAGSDAKIKELVLEVEEAQKLKDELAAREVELRNLLDAERNRTFEFGAALAVSDVKLKELTVNVDAAQAQLRRREREAAELAAGIDTIQGQLRQREREAAARNARITELEAHQRLLRVAQRDAQDRKERLEKSLLYRVDRVLAARLNTSLLGLAELDQPRLVDWTKSEGAQR